MRKKNENSRRCEILEGRSKRVWNQSFLPIVQKMIQKGTTPQEVGEYFAELCLGGIKSALEEADAETKYLNSVLEIYAKETSDLS